MNSDNHKAGNSARVEAYLDQVLAPLTHQLTPFHRAELRRELRTHLWERVDAYRELGQTEDDAVTEALRQFGGAEDFTRQWRREWMKTAVVSASTLRIWDAGKSALKPSLAGIAGAFLPAVVISSLYQGLQHSAVGTFLYHYRDPIYWSWIGFAFLLLPVFVGVRQGWRQPRHAETGVAAVLVSEIAAVSLLYLLVDGTAPDNLYAESLCSILLALVVLWLPVAGGAAALSGWWARRSKSRRLA